MYSTIPITHHHSTARDPFGRYLTKTGALGVSISWLLMGLYGASSGCLSRPSSAHFLRDNGTLLTPTDGAVRPPYPHFSIEGPNFTKD